MAKKLSRKQMLRVLSAAWDTTKRRCQPSGAKRKRKEDMSIRLNEGWVACVSKKMVRGQWALKLREGRECQEE